MYLTKYLVVIPNRKTWQKPTVKLLDKVSNAQIPGNAVVLKLGLELPDELFKKPMLEAKIIVNKEQVSKPIIDAQVLDNIKEVMTKQLGVDLTVNVVEEGKGNE